MAFVVCQDIFGVLRKEQYYVLAGAFAQFFFVTTDAT
jgi:hypothetical protein